MSSVKLPDGLFDTIGSAFTVSFWIHGEASGGPIQLITGPDTLVYGCPESVRDWHHLRVTRDSVAGLMRFYWDGMIAAEDRSVDESVDGVAIGISRLGAALSGHYEFMNGKLDEFRLYNRSLWV